MLELIKFSKGKTNYIKGLALLSPWMIAMKARLISNTLAKEKMLSVFFNGTPLNEFNSICKSFSEKKLPGLIRTDAMEAIESHKKQEHEVVVVSASAENWIRDWCNKMELQFLGTRLMDENNIISGKLSGANCNGQEKVNRIKMAFDLSAYSSIYCYGDTKGDTSMLSLATHPFYQYFTK